MLYHTTRLLLLLVLSFSLATFASQKTLRPIKEVIEPTGEFPAEKFWKVAVIQWNPPTASEIGINRERAEEIKQQNRIIMSQRIAAAASQGAKYIVLSEFAVVGYPDIPELPDEEDEYRNRDDLSPYVETIPGKSSQLFALLSKQFGVWIQFGLAEVDESTNLYYNSVAVVDDQGTLVAKYRKQNLYKVETEFLSAGNENVIFKTPAGIFGLVICSDIYNYDILNKYRNMTVDVLSLSTSWAEMNTGMSHFISAAKFTRSFLLAANQTYFPDSGVINPNGSLQSHIRQSRDAIAYGYLPLKQ